MSTLRNLLVVAFVSLMVMSCKNETQPEVKTVDNELATSKAELDPNATYAKAEFGIDGMTCAMGCAKTIEKKIAKMDGVKSATVDFEKELAMVEYDEAKVTTNSLEEAVAKAGSMYKVKDMKTVEKFSSESKACSAKCKKECKSKAKNKETACSKECKETCTSKKKNA